jgi:hypothetical protein
VDPDEYPGAGGDETEDIRLLSLVTVFGILQGIDWHRTSTDEEIVIEEKIYAVIRDMQLEEISEFEDCYRYTYSYTYIVEKFDERKVGRAIEAEGTSELDNLAEAWREARESAFIDAVQQALDRKYTENQLAIPPEVRGMITVYEMLYDDFDFGENVYRFKIKAWVGFEPRQVGILF